jgi:PAS domain S-box-containing protein
MDVMKSVFMARGTAVESGSRSFSRRNGLLVFIFALLPLAPPAVAQATPKNVLILSGGRGRVSINQMEASLRAHFSAPVNFSVVDLDNPRFDQESYRDNLAEALKNGYSGERLDLVVAVMTASLQFAVRYRDKVFPGVPIVFMSNDTPLPKKMWPGVTGVESTPAIRETIDLALRFHPDAQAVAVIAKPSGPNKDWLSTEHIELLRHRDKVREIDVLGPASPELLQRVAELPPGTVVLFQLYPEDADQPAFGALDVLASVAQRFPTYSILPHIILGRGGVAAASYDPTKDAVLAGELAARVLSGERPDKIPVVQNSDPVVSVDWRALQRWHIPESALPPGTHVLYREPTLWEQGRKYFLTAIAVIFVQSLLIFGLFWQRTRRRRAELKLEKSEEKFSKAFRRSPFAITIVTASDGCYVDVNETFEFQTGWKRDEVIGRTPLDINLWLNPDQRTAFMGELRDKGNIRDLEVPFRRKDGQIRTSLGSAEMIEVNGQPCALSVIADVTERKMAEEAISGFGRRLIEAQETERTRIARELHDDINQRLAMVAVGLKTLKRGLPNSDQEASRGIDEACVQISELESDIQALSHRLHSSKLEYLGLEAAASGFCRELSERQNVKIDFRCDGLPEDLSGDVSLCLFRVLQEALHNAVKYSGVDEFDVSLEYVSQAIQLKVHDSGTGFDPKLTAAGVGLGLTSMKERLKLVSGELSIQSKPQEGTTIFARIPTGQGTTTDQRRTTARAAA